ncbi:Sigma-54 dependent DNA-binding response regulator [uncultured Desulfobacterium sp.]|uniref:Sigma-54 dependent DNA-binding response regulator n=1 Tax=uncultured Desulfobacterium sp. TaxID=201089 RepID=A0A445MYS5_9BACT|nr:Sigma-54 dependent DNA-binding response regulator [uncultured Desulfobacterium sp.]
MIKYTIFVVDDEETIREGVTMALEGTYRISAFSTAEAAIKAFKKEAPDLVLLDIGLPGMDGVQALREIKNIQPEALVIMITAFEDAKTVISAMKLGAYDYVIKPIHMDGLDVTIRNALDTIRLRKEVHSLQEHYLKENLPCFIAESNAIQDVMEFISLVAKSPDTPILIHGETGTGKELIASAIHYRSPNFKGPLVTVNCASIPKDLVESEMFGYEKGAFSGANLSGKRGLVEEAADGTLFLDEVGDLSQEAQAKLLRFLEEGEFYRIGGTKKIHIKTRVVSATNKNLDAMIAEGLFRKDLYFRLGVIKVDIPSLNERKEDIIPIARHFLYEFGKKFNKKMAKITPQAETALYEHNWTGNVRELRNLIERAVLISRGQELTVDELGIRSGTTFKATGNLSSERGMPRLTPEGMDIVNILDSYERHYISEALRMSGGNESQAAKLLNMNHHTFRYRRKKLELK